MLPLDDEYPDRQLVARLSEVDFAGTSMIK
jgi:hypothetical protein